MNTVRFRGENCKVQFGKYGNGRTAIMLVRENGEPMAKASLNLEAALHWPLSADEIAIKDYSENEGMLAALTGAGIVSAPLRDVACGFVRVPICRLLVQP